ncbi:MAG TPA: hypothetical protein VNW92_03990 [Polyangiaceae bacterium]|nr:hypothetical protein [Polyangiaceae bacterium]
MKCSVRLGLVVALLSACGGTSSPSQGAQAGAGGAGDAGGSGIAGAGGRSSGGGSASGASAGGSAGSAGGLPMTVSAGAHAVVHFGLNDECGGEALPVMNGQANCRAVLTGVTGGCTTAGLSAATSADLSAVTAAALAAGASSVAQPVCQVTQLPVGSSAACAASSAAAWCYVNGACDATSTKTCADAICVTPMFAAAKVMYQLPAWIVCD